MTNNQEFHQKLLKNVIEAVEIRSATTFSWFGHLSERIHPRIKTRLTPKIAQDYLHFNLKLRLYSSFYCRGLPVPIEPGQARPPASITPFVEQLSAANVGQGYWKRSSDIRLLEGNGAMVRLEGLDLFIPESALLSREAFGELEAGQSLQVKLPKEFLGMSPGFYMALSDRELTHESTDSLVRIYWHLLPEGAVPLMAGITTQLNRANLPFNFKVLNEPTQFKRCDAAVLYFRQQDYDAIAECLEQVYPSVAHALRARIPAFTKEIAGGVGLAEDPGDGESFGLHRCSILAHGLILAYEQGVKSLAHKLKVIEDRFQAEGITLEAPYLKGASKNLYSCLVLGHPSAPQTSPASPPTQPDPIQSDLIQSSPPELYLQTAYGLGQKLCRSAIWFEDQCNWIGAEPERQIEVAPGTGSTWITLGADLYGGTSGIALFLGELYTLTGDSEIRRTAIGAIRQALARLETCPPPFRLGLYSGWTGIAVAAARLGTVLKEPELIESAVQLVNRTICEIPIGPEFDLISGIAGGLSGLLCLQKILKTTLNPGVKGEVSEDSWLDFAQQLGDALVQFATPEVAGCSWGAKPTRSRNLLGFSHGTAGVAYALLELFQVTGETRYQQMAQLALDYERHWFDAEALNWPDFREDSALGRRKRSSYSFMTAWCHGAAGVALSRLRAYELFAEERYKTEAITALETTHRVTEQWLSSGTANYSLCHGLVGNAEVLIYGTQVLGDSGNSSAQLVNHIVIQGIERCGKNHDRWPGGINTGETPGLMLGLSGIGYFYLRLYQPKVPSVLIAQPEKFLKY